MQAHKNIKQTSNLFKEKPRKLSTSGQPKSTNVTNRQHTSVQNMSKMSVSEDVSNSVVVC